MEALRIIIAGGGTGGHIFPAVAIAHALKKLRPQTQLLFVGAKGKMEMEKVPLEGFEIVGLDIVGFNRTHLLKNILLPFKLLKSFTGARSILRRFQPHAVVGVGGYASFPVLNAAQGKNIPTLIQEQNSYAGKSNKILSRRAKRVCVAYEGMEQFFPKEKLELTGNPVRQSIVANSISKEAACAKMDLNPQKQTVLIVGGSLGAASINEAIHAHLDELVAADLQLIWQTGKHYAETATEASKPHTESVKVFEFIREMEVAYAAADLVISRAGALAIAELCIVAKPVIFVPYPFAAEDHQTQNAMALTKKNAALMVSNSDAKTKLIPALKKLLSDTAMQKEMQHQLKEMAITDADARIADCVIEIAGMI